MRNDHLSDEQIQEYLDGNKGNTSSSVRQHLELCAGCRKVLGDYRTLYAHLEAVPVWDPGSDFAGTLFPLLPSGRRYHLSFYWVSILISFLAISGGLLLAVGPLSLGSMASRIFKLFAPLSKSLRPFIGKILERMDGNVPLIMTIFLALLTVAVADRFLGRRLFRAAGARH